MIPVIACGGVGRFAHLVKGATEGGASAVSAANIFHFTEHSTQRAKRVLADAGVDIRLSGVQVR
jgi:cyclase